MYFYIFFLIDGSDCVDVVLDYVIEYVCIYDVMFVVFYVVDVCEVGYVVFVFLFEWVCEVFFESGEQVLDCVVQVVCEVGVEVEIVVMEGMFVSEIICYVDEWEVDFVVMGIYGCSGIDCYFIGSVVECVVCGFDVFVLMV